MHFILWLNKQFLFCGPRVQLSTHVIITQDIIESFEFSLGHKNLRGDK